LKKPQVVRVAAKAAELNDSIFRFRVNVPDKFTELERSASEPDTIQKFINREPTTNNPAHAILIQHIRSVIALTDRLKKSGMPIIKGIHITLQDFIWKGLQLDVMSQTMVLPTSVHYARGCRSALC
jgi:hypothetical protein